MSRNKRISIFLSIALVWSLIWFSQKQHISDLWQGFSLITILSGLVPIVGLVLGALYCRKLRRDNSTTLFGPDSRFSLLIFSVPVICLTIIGIPNSLEIHPNLFGFGIGIFTLVYATMEEIGWRGYLQEEFDKSNRWIGYIIIGLVWYLWHWYFFRSSGNPRLIMIPILILSSIGIGETARMTRSILICGAVHGLANILLIYPLVSRNISSIGKISVLAVCLVVWVPVVYKMAKGKKLS